MNSPLFDPVPPGEEEEEERKEGRKEGRKESVNMVKI